MLTGLPSLLAPATSPAAVSTFGSPLSVPATLNTAENLAYTGTNTAVPPSREAPTGNVHTYHYGADTALWNVALASGQPAAPATGQAVKVSLEGCAQPAANGLPPLTQIHFQDISPLPNGGARVNLTSQAFEIPVCGLSGASGSTVTTYEPTNLCVSEGDYVDLNEEGGFVEHAYQSGVAYQVFGSVNGSTLDSFIKGNGTGNGARLSAQESSAMDGFASNPGEELMLQVRLGTGPDASHNCGGGTAGLPPPPPPRPAIGIKAQTDGVNHSQIVSVAIYCGVSPRCSGLARLTAIGKHAGYGHARFSVPGSTTAHVPIHVTSHMMALIHRNHGVSTVLSVVMTHPHTTMSQIIDVKIF